MIEYFIDGTVYVCKKHYHKIYLDVGKHLQKIKSPRAGLCIYCTQENEALIPRAKVFPIISPRRFMKSVHEIIDPIPYQFNDEFDSGLMTMPDGHLRWTFPKFMPLRSDQVKALETVADPAKFLTKLEHDWRSNRWTLEIFRKMPLPAQKTTERSGLEQKFNNSQMETSEQ